MAGRSPSSLAALPWPPPFLLSGLGFRRPRIEVRVASLQRRTEKRRVPISSSRLNGTAPVSRVWHHYAGGRLAWFGDRRSSPLRQLEPIGLEDRLVFRTPERVLLRPGLLPPSFQPPEGPGRLSLPDKTSCDVAHIGEAGRPVTSI